MQTGDRVREGQLLVTLDARDLDVNSRRAEAALDEVRSSVPEADSAVAGAKANLDLAQATFNRMQELLNKKSISNQEFDEASAKLKSAQAAYEMARARRAQLDAQAGPGSAGSAMPPRSTRSYAEITAPFAGVVTAKSVDPGTLAVPGAPLLTIEREGAYRLEASVEESQLSAIRVGQPVSVTLDGIDRTLDARVSEIVPAVDAASRSYTVKIDLPTVPALRSGAFGRASFSTGQPLAAHDSGGRGDGARPVAIGVGGGKRRRAHPPDHARGRSRKTRSRCSPVSRAGRKVIFPVPQGFPTEPQWRSGREGRTQTRSGGKVRAGLDRLQADASGDRRLVAAGRVRGLETAARGGAADHRADGGRVRPDAGRFGARSRGARHQADGEAAVGDPRRRVHLLDIQPRHVHGHRAFPGRPGRREEPSSG